MRAYVVVDKNGKIIKDAGISFRRDQADIVITNDFGEKTGEEIKSFTIPESELK
jgi:hypothetical protein